ncbi:unnamed protein product [Soboliphyme baturini]|uniref:Nuclear cap-binding protein subunit 1 n=1 Tax=Soboliphyme baturini TaxID=241478 RepID=A0A183IG73_9BILA|nr:unnamed protein product [Soboliphyme baturini]
MAQESVFRLSQQLVSALTNTENNKLVFSNFYDCLLFPDRHHSSENMRLKSFQKLLSIVNQLQNVQGGAENITSVKTLIENAELLSRSSDSCAVLYFVLLLSDASRAKDEWSNGDITNSTFNNDFSIKSLCEAVKEHAHSSTSAANIFTCDVYCDWVTAFPSFFRFSQAPRKDSQKKPTKVSSQSMNEVVDRRNASFWPLYIPLASLKLQSRSDRRQTLHSMMPLLSDLSENDFARFGMPALYEPVMLMTGDFGIMHNFSVLNISRLKLIVQGLLIGVESGCIVLDQILGYVFVEKMIFTICYFSSSNRITWLTAYKVSKSSVPGFLYQLFDKLAFCGKAVSLLNVRIKSLANEVTV